MFKRRDMPLSALRAFESAGRHLHLGRAGADLGVTHGAISHQIRALERQLGVKLFTRAHNRLQLTSAGARLLTAVREGLDRIVDGALHLSPDDSTGDLVIACTQTIAETWAVKQVAQFGATYPQIRIRLVEIEPQQESIPAEVDVALCYGAPDSAGRRCEELVAAPLFPVCSPRLLRGSGAFSHPEDLSKYTLLADRQNSWERWYESMNALLPNGAHQIALFSNVLCLKAARLGLGIALGNPLEVHEDLEEGLLVELLNRSVSESESYFLLADELDSQSLRARLFEQWIRDRALDFGM
jgi:LysR family glycine cleavage system transcriptional activator